MEKKFRFLYLYSNGYESAECLKNSDMTVEGIIISPTCTIAPFYISEAMQRRDFLRVVFSSVHKHIPVSPEDLTIIRHRRSEINAMLAEIGSKATIPEKGNFWVQRQKQHGLPDSFIMNEKGERNNQVDRACLIYKLS